MKNVPIFPNYVVTYGLEPSGFTKVTCKTKVRIQHDGNFYLRLCEFEVNSKITNETLNGSNVLLSGVAEFIKKVYVVLFFSDVNTDAINPDSKDLIFQLDEDQRSELERLHGMGDLI